MLDLHARVFSTPPLCISVGDVQEMSLELISADNDGIAPAAILTLDGKNGPQVKPMAAENTDTSSRTVKLDGEHICI